MARTKTDGSHRSNSSHISWQRSGDLATISACVAVPAAAVLDEPPNLHLSHTHARPQCLHYDNRPQLLEHLLQSRRLVFKQTKLLTQKGCRYPSVVVALPQVMEAAFDTANVALTIAAQRHCFHRLQSSSKPPWRLADLLFVNSSIPEVSIPDTEHKIGRSNWGIGTSIVIYGKIPCRIRMYLYASGHGG